MFDWQLATDHWQLFLQQLRHIFFVEVDRQHVVELLAVGILAPEVAGVCRWPQCGQVQIGIVCAPRARWFRGMANPIYGVF